MNTNDIETSDDLSALFSNDALYGAASGLRGRPVNGDGRSERDVRRPKRVSQSKVAINSERLAAAKEKLSVTFV